MGGRGIDRGSRGGRLKRDPDIFLSHSSRDKDFVHRLAVDLCTLGVDAFLDSWELEVGTSLQRVLGDALERSRYVGLVVSEHFHASRWATDEMAQAMSRERRNGEKVVLPLLVGDSRMPSFLEDRVYLDFREDYFSALLRLAAAIHGVPKQRLELVMAARIDSLEAAVDALQATGHEIYMIFDKPDLDAMVRMGGRVDGETVVCDPHAMKDNSGLSPVMVKCVQLWLKGHGLVRARARRTRWKASRWESSRARY